MKILPHPDDFIDIHTHNDVRSPGVFKIHNYMLGRKNTSCKELPCSLGLHPWDISSFPLESLEEHLAGLIESNDFLFLGETGLDKIRGVDFETQKKVFALHIKLSQKYNKPLIIHCVKAYQEIIDFRKEFDPATPWILHGFNSSKEMAGQMINHGIHISLGEAMMNNRKKFSDIYNEPGTNGIFLESDDSRYDIQEIYEAFSEVSGIEMKSLREYLYQNFMSLFANHG